jgi:hypothetical protein
MGEARYTPGPWRIDTKARNSGFAVVANEPKRSGGTKSIVTARPSYSTPESISEARANASLIASAPSMHVQLDVLTGDLVMLRRAIEEGDPRTELLFRIDDMLRDTRAVLAKVEA